MSSDLPPIQSSSAKKRNQLPPIAKKNSQEELEQQQPDQFNHNEQQIDQNIQQDQLSQPRSSSLQQRLSSSFPSVNRKGVVVVQGRFTAKSTFLCYFCGGASCKKERAECNPHQNPIQGLHCDWITDNILAMQRPSSQLILRHHLIQQFKQQLSSTIYPQVRNRIGAILNLQEPGEHPSCGPPLIQQSGFTYSPEDFQRNGIHFFNYGWEDMEITTFENIMRVVSSFQMIFEKGQKIAVHCHAGTGRTGVSIAAWLIYGERMTALQAIKLFQQRRHNSLGKSAHQKLLKDFEQYLNINRRCFDYPKLPLMSIEELIKTQNRVLIGRDQRQARFLPIVMHVILRKLQELLQLNKITSEEICACFCDLDNERFFKDKWSLLFEEELSKTKELFNQHDFSLGNISDLRILCQLLLDFFDKLPRKAISDDAAIILANEIQERDDLKEIFLDPANAKLLGNYQFELISTTAKFARLLRSRQNVSDSEMLRKLVIRFSISYLQKKRYLDKCFFRRSLLDPSLITMSAVIDLSDVIYKMSNMDSQQEEKVASEIQNEEGQKASLMQFQQNSEIEMDFFKLSSSLKHQAPLDGNKSSKIIPL